MIARIYIDGKRLDLSEDENITVKSSVSDASDIKKTKSDFTKGFTVPASANNNKIFKHYYNADIDNSFDARTKVNGRIELSGVPFKFGKFRLLKVSVKNGKPENYTINFVSNLVDINKELGKDKLSSLPLSFYDFDLNGNNVKQKLTTIFAGDVIYTLNPKKQYFYNSDVNDITDTDEITNIADNGSSEIHGVRFGDLSPSIRVIRLIDAIEEKYNLKFSRDFFGTSVFTRLFQTLTNSKDKLGGASVQVDFDSGDTDFVSLETNIGSFPTQNTSASNDRVKWENRLTIIPSSGYENVNYTLDIIIDGQVSSSETSVGQKVFKNDLSTNGFKTFDVSFDLTTSEEFKFSAVFIQYRSSSISGEPDVSAYRTNASEKTINSRFVVSKNISNITIADWLVGLFKAFKLVVIPQQDGTLYVDTINRYYSLGKIVDITKHIDFKTYNVERGELFNEISFKFEDPNTILNKQFETNNGIAYGNEEVALKDEDGEPLDGDTYSIEVPFETVVYDRLNDVRTTGKTSIMYAPFIDENRAASFPKCNLFYNQAVSISANPIRFINNNNSIDSLSSFINTAKHNSEDISSDSGNSFLFGSEFNEWNGNILNNNLYTNYHKNYIDGIFNIKRRNFTFKAILPLQISTKLNLNDVIKIKGGYYRIDNYQANIVSGETTFKLINSFSNDLDNLININDTINFGSEADSNVSTINNNTSSALLSDLGDGIDWLTATINQNELTVSVDQNNTGVIRSAFVIVSDDTKKLPNFDLLINQDRGSITFDNETITFDNEIITFDNG